MKVIIIGAGLGGLSAAIRLANQGVEVEVYELGSMPGGKAGNLIENGFRFDTGPSLLTLPQVIEEIFTESHEDINSYLKFEKLEILSKNYFEDGKIINSYSDIDRFAKEISEKTNDTKESVFRFFKYAKSIYDNTSDVFIFNSLNKFFRFSISNLKYLGRVTKLDAMRTMHEAVSSFFSDFHTRQIFDRFATYNGSNPYKTPATLNVISYVEHGIGGYYLQEGIYSLSQALYKLAIKKGVKFYFNSEVKKIIHEDKVVNGIEVNGQIKNAEYIISNADVNFTFSNLLGDENSIEAKKYRKLEPSSSAFVFNWGIDSTFPELDIHNIFFSSDYKKEFDQIFELKEVPSDPTIYVNISSKYNHKDAPEGKENWFVLVNVPYDAGQNWDDEGIGLKDRVLDKIERLLGKSVRDRIVYESILTPKDIFNSTKSTYGSLYGIASNTKFSAFSRQQAKSKSYDNLYFCGGSAHPGGGIPLVLISGKLAAEAILTEVE